VITKEQLKILSNDRLEDAKRLYEAERFDWAVYTCGYAVELALKKKICETLRWHGYPNTKKEFEKLQSFKTHELDMLLHFSGIEDQIKVEGAEEFAIWSILASWNPEMRYSSQGQTKDSAKLLIESAETFLRKL
jgi:HEPN domain-containing protein